MSRFFFGHAFHFFITKVRLESLGQHRFILPFTATVAGLSSVPPAASFGAGPGLKFRATVTAG